MKDYLFRVFAFLGLFVLFTLGDCARKDAESARSMLKEYWTSVFTGQTVKAYRYLTWESRRRWSYERYSEHVSWVKEKGAAADSFWAAYGPLTRINVGSVKISGDSAWVDMALVYPDVSERVARFSSEADSLFSSKDSLARHRWILEQVAKALKDRHYRPFVQYLKKIPLHWEWGGWRLVYK